MAFGRSGRPTTFKAEYIEEMEKFFNAPYERREVIKSMVEYDENGEEKRKAEEYKILPAKFPSLYAFSKHINVPFDAVQSWAERGADLKIEEKQRKSGGIYRMSRREVQLMKDLNTFSRAYQEAKRAQKEFLINNGLSGASPAAAFIFTAKNVTDMRDKVETEVSHRIVTPLLEHMSIDTATQTLPNPQKTLEE